MSEDPKQTWELVVDGHAHLVEVHGDWSRRVTWYVDGAEVASRKSGDDRLVLESGAGRLEVRHSGLGRARRATYTPPGGDAVDLVPEPGSPAAAYEERLREHPTRTSVIAAAGAVAGIVVPLLLAGLLARFAFSLPWPDWDLPSVPTPDLPSVPWPDLPSIPWPDWSLPGWVREVLDKAGFVWPVVLAVVIARAEVRRRRRQDALRAERRAGHEDRGDGDPGQTGQAGPARPGAS